MNKQAILEAISQALDASGAFGDDDFYGEQEGVDGGGGGSTVPIWSQLQVGVNDAGRGPIHSKDALFLPQQQMKPPTSDPYGMPMPGDEEEALLAMGIV